MHFAPTWFVKGQPLAERPGAVELLVELDGCEIRTGVMMSAGKAGAGLLLGSVAYDLIAVALRSSSLLLVTAAFFLGSATFLIGNLLLDRLGQPTGSRASPLVRSCGTFF